jgi:hypothetical protein
MINTRGDDVARRSTLRLAASLALGAVLLSGCSEKQEANDTLPTPSSSAAETTPELPPLGPEDFPVPVEAREKTPEGALAFAKYYMSLGMKIGQGDIPSKALLDLSTPECRLCGRVAASFAEDQAAGYTRRGSSSTFEEYGLPLLTEDTADVGFVFTQSADQVIDREGKEVPSRAGKASGDLQSGMQLTWRDDLECWLVNSLTVG